MNFRQLGSLCLFKNGELSFTNFEDGIDNDTLSLLSHRLKPRQIDTISIIDRASAILSSGGIHKAGNFSVRSSFMDNISI